MLKVGDYVTTKKSEAGIIAEITPGGVVVVLPRVVPATDSVPGQIIGAIKIVLDRLAGKVEDFQKVGWIKIKEIK
jgi:hypothetical protein